MAKKSGKKPSGTGRAAPKPQGSNKDPRPQPSGDSPKPHGDKLAGALRGSGSSKR